MVMKIAGHTPDPVDVLCPSVQSLGGGLKAYCVCSGLPDKVQFCKCSFPEV